MFIQDVWAKENLKESIQKFKRNIRSKLLSWADANLKVDPSRLPEVIPLGVISWVLATSLLFKNRSEITWDTEKFYQEAIAVNKLLWEEIYRIDQDLGKKTGNLPSNEREEQLDKELLEKGIEGYAIFYDFNGNEWQNYIVTKELLLEIIQDHPTLKNCLISAILPPCSSLPLEKEVEKDSVDLKPPATINELKIEKIVNKWLNISARENIKSINVFYKGRYGQKPTLLLIIKVMCIMIELKYSYDGITWSSVKEFIEDYIASNYDLKSLIQLEIIDDYVLKVGSHTIQKDSCQDRVSEYKRKIFNLT